MREPRNIAVYVILTIVTCGIWGLVWFFQLGSDIQALRGDSKPNTLVDFLLTWVTCGLYGFYIAYQWPVLLQEPLRARGVHVDNNLPVLSLVLAVFGLNIVSVILMQSAVNDGFKQMGSS